MTNALLILPENTPYQELINSLDQHQIKTDIQSSGKDALISLAENRHQLVVTHEDLPDVKGRSLVESIITQNPMMNCVVISELTEKEFHQTFEGLGVLMRFPDPPGQADVEKLIDHLKKINALFKS